MSIADRTPFDFLGNTGFRLWVQRLPDTSFSVQKVRLPGLTLPINAEVNPFVNIPKAGDHVQYNELTIEFLVDELLNNYMEIHNWIRGLGKPTSFWQYKKVVTEAGTGVASNILLTILDAKKNPKTKVTFENALPVSLSDLVFDSTSPDLQYISVTATFAYSSFKVEADTN